MSPRSPQQYEIIRNEKQQLIMEVALRLFANEGFHATSIAKIAKEAGISKGLLYNYFNSKEELFKQLIDKHTKHILTLLDPNNDKKITNEEANSFFDKLFVLLVDQREEMKLYFQMMLQPQVFEMYSNGNSDSYVNPENPSSQNTMHMLLDFFTNNADDDPMMVLMEWISVVKGFALQYVFAPEMFTDEMLLNFKTHLKNRFVKK